MVSLPGWHASISRTPPGMSPTWRPLLRAPMMLGRVASITRASMLTQPMEGTHFEADDCAITMLPPKRSERCSNHGSTLAGYFPCGCKP
eukprot:7148562-Prymnesium_polylepis.2